MKWQGRRQSSNVNDQRSSGGGGRNFGRGGALGGVGLLVLVVVALLSGNPQMILDNLIGTTSPPQSQSYVETPKDKERMAFISVVLADTEDIWTDIFKEHGMQYKKPVLTVFSGSVKSACGVAGASTGPFYCPGDNNLYLDLSFFDEMENKFKAPGDFAMAYVIAHEVGHHVQTSLGVTEQFFAQKGKVSESQYNDLSVRFELQADYLAGVWAKRVENKGYVESGDIKEAMGAAAAVGDDRIQKQARGYVIPDSFTHGTSEQRMRWFDKGYSAGDLSEWDTFKVKEL